MAVPAHDERDFEFAEKFGLPIRRVVAAPGTEDDRWSRRVHRPPADEVLVNSGEFNGLPADEGGRRIVADLARRSGSGRRRSPTGCATG